jgi:hypothetical protein
MQVVREGIETELIVVWRRDQLGAAGFPLPLAARIAEDARFDAHALIELTERGCAPDVAVRILAPLESEGNAA